MSGVPQGRRLLVRPPWRFVVALHQDGQAVLDCGHSVWRTDNNVRTVVGAPDATGDQCRCPACFHSAEENLKAWNLARGDNL